MLKLAKLMSSSHRTAHRTLVNKQGSIKGGGFADPKVFPRFGQSSEWKRFRQGTFSAGHTNPHMGHEVAPCSRFLPTAVPLHTVVVTTLWRC